MDANDEIKIFTNKFIKKINDNLNNFSYNIIIANLHEMYSYMIKNIDRGYKQDTIKDNYRKILTILMPIIPHFSSECLEMIGQTSHSWPNYDQKIIMEDKINFVIQINGKKRSLLYLEKNKSKAKIMEIVKKEESLSKYLKDNKIRKIIFVPKKLINIII